MSADWNTKYGTRRVRHDPPTLDEAIFAAVGITDDQAQQAEGAAQAGKRLDGISHPPTLIISTTRRNKFYITEFLR